MEVFFYIVIGVSSILFVLFIIKEIWRNFGNGELKNVLQRDNKKNIESLLGITKTTFLVLMASLVTISISSLAFLKLSTDINERTDVNNETIELIQSMLNRLEK